MRRSPPWRKWLHSSHAPSGFGGSGKIPNVQETSNPAKILTVEFEKGRIRWPDLRLLDMEVDGY